MPAGSYIDYIGKKNIIRGHQVKCYQLETRIDMDPVDEIHHGVV